MRRLFLLLYLCCVCVPAFVAQAQDNITRNEPFVSQITSGDQQRYRFIAQDGEVLSIVARAIFVGLERAVREMKDAIEKFRV